MDDQLMSYSLSNMRRTMPDHTDRDGGHATVAGLAPSRSPKARPLLRR